MNTLISTFFSNLGIAVESLDIQTGDTEIFVDLKTPDSKLLIGVHGKTLEAIEHLLSRVIEQKSGEHTRVHLEINDYIKSKNERLYQLVEQRIFSARHTGKPAPINGLSSYERKKVHDYIKEKDDPALSTKSEDIDGIRRLYIYRTETKVAPQTSHISISEDGINI